MKYFVVAVLSFTAGSLSTLLCVPRRVEAASTEIMQVSGHRWNEYAPIVPPITSSNPVPVVEPFPPVISRHNQYTGVTPLDGLVSENDVFGNKKGTVFLYGGGAFRLLNATLEGPLSFRFTGAAANTVALLDSVGLLLHREVSDPNPSALPTPQQINKTKTTKTVLRKPLHGDIASQFDGSQR